MRHSNKLKETMCGCVTSDSRLANEIEHGKFLARHDAGEIWNWETPAGLLRWKRRVKMLTSHIRPGMNVLELGCGTGYFTKEIAKTGALLTAIDISPDLINIAKESMKDNENTVFLIQNAYNMDFDNNRFDSVVGSSVLHHLDVDKALRECFRVLKPGGSIYFTEPNMLNPQIALQKSIPYLKKKIGDSPDEKAFFKWSLKKKLETFGFSNILITPFDFLHPSIPKSFLPVFLPLAKFLESIPLVLNFAGSLSISAEKW